MGPDIGSDGQVTGWDRRARRVQAGPASWARTDSLQPAGRFPRGPLRRTCVVRVRGSRFRTSATGSSSRPGRPRARWIVFDDLRFYDHFPATLLEVHHLPCHQPDALLSSALHVPRRPRWRGGAVGGCARARARRRFRARRRSFPAHRAIAGCLPHHHIRHGQERSRLPSYRPPLPRTTTTCRREGRPRTWLEQADHAGLSTEHHYSGSSGRSGRTRSTHEASFVPSYGEREAGALTTRNRTVVRWSRGRTDETRADAFFRALSDRTRRDILRRVLAGEHSVSTLAAKLRHELRRGSEARSRAGARRPADQATQGREPSRAATWLRSARSA